MFNVLLIVAGVLEYILLGIDFEVNYSSVFPMVGYNNCPLSEQYKKHLPRRHPDYCRIHECCHRLSSNSKVRGDSRVIPCHDTSLVPRGPQWQDHIWSRC
jgi:hypothetical protein